jgi:hypothetical protein
VIGGAATDGVNNNGGLDSLKSDRMNRPQDGKGDEDEDDGMEWRRWGIMRWKEDRETIKSRDNFT